jgi:hypothetical protein
MVVFWVVTPCGLVDGQGITAQKTTMDIFTASTTDFLQLQNPKVDYHVKRIPYLGVIFRVS